MVATPNSHGWNHQYFWFFNPKVTTTWKSRVTSQHQVHRGEAPGDAMDKMAVSKWVV